MKGEGKMIVIFSWVIILVFSGFSIYFFKKYKSTTRKIYLFFFMLIIGLSLILIQVEIKTAVLI